MFIPVVRLATPTSLLEVCGIATLQEGAPTGHRIITSLLMLLSSLPGTVLHRINVIVLCEWPLLFVECRNDINDSNGP